MPPTAPLLEQTGLIGSIAPASRGEETDHQTPAKLIQSKAPDQRFIRSAAASVPNHLAISCSRALLAVGYPKVPVPDSASGRELLRDANASVSWHGCLQGECPSSSVCQHSAHQLPLRKSCLFVFLVVAGVFAGNCISTRTSADTATVEGRAISLHL